MRVRLLVAPVLLASALSVSNARADGEEFSRTGAYIGVSGVYGLNILESAVDDLFSDIEVDDTWGANARLGYRATSWLAAEVEYEYLDNFELSVDDVHLADLQAQTISGNLRFILPIRRFQPYLRLGIGATFFDLEDNAVPGLEVDDSSLSGRIGLGADVYLTPNLVVGVGADAVLSTAEVEDPVFSGDTSSTLSYVALHAGLELRF